MRSVIFTISADASAATRSIGELRKEIRDLTRRRDLEELGSEEFEQLSEEIINAKAQLSEFRREERQLVREQQALIRANEATGDSYNELSQRLNRLRNDYRNLSAAQRDGIVGQNQLREINELDEQLKSIDASIGNYQRNVGNYRDAIASIQEAILSGTPPLTAFSEGFNALTTSVRASATALLSNPFTAIAASVTAAAVAFGKLVEFNKDIADTNILVQRLANTTGEATDQLRIQAQALTDTFDNSFEDNVRALIELQRDFGISAEEAFQIYEDGLIRGGAGNQEFSDSIREYGSLLSGAGFSAQEFVDILNTGIDLGVYTDKLPDAIKEATISLSEETGATRDALINAFGEEFTDQLSEGVRNGSITVRDALIQIQQESERAQLNTQQLAQLTADVFRGAGEDAGGALVVFEALTQAVIDPREPLNELQQEVDRLAEANLRLAEAREGAFSSEELQQFGKDLEVLRVNALASFFEGLARIRGVFEDIGRISRALNLGEIFGNVARQIGRALNVLFPFQDAIRGITNSIDFLKESLGINEQIERENQEIAQAVLATQQIINNRNEAFQAASDRFIRLLENEPEQVRNAGRELVNELTQRNNSIAENFNEGLISQEEYIRRSRGLISQLNRGIVNTQGVVENTVTESNESTRRDLSESFRNIENEFRNNEITITEYRQRLITLISNRDGLGDNFVQKVADDIDEATRIISETNQRIQDANNISFLFDAQLPQDQLPQIIESEEAKQAVIRDIQVRNLRLQEADLRESLDERGRIELEALRTQYDNALLSYQEYEDQRNQIAISSTQRQLDIQRQRTETGLEILSSSLRFGAEISREQAEFSKALAIASATIDLFSGALKALSTGGIAGLAQIPVILAAGARLINTIRSVEIPGYASGGKIENGVPIRRSNGDNVLITAKTGEVILNERQQQALGGPDTFARIGVPGFNNGGIVPQIINSAPQSNTFNVVASLSNEQINYMSESIAMMTGREVRSATADVISSSNKVIQDRINLEVKNVQRRK